MIEVSPDIYLWWYILIPRKCQHKTPFQHTVNGGPKSLKICLRKMWMVPKYINDFNTQWMGVQKAWKCAYVRCEWSLSTSMIDCCIFERIDDQSCQKCNHWKLCKRTLKKSIKGIERCNLKGWSSLKRRRYIMLFAFVKDWNILTADP